MGSGRGNRTSTQVCSCKPSRDVDTSSPTSRGSAAQGWGEENLGTCTSSKPDGGFSQRGDPRTPLRGHTT